MRRASLAKIIFFIAILLFAIAVIAGAVGSCSGFESACPSETAYGQSSFVRRRKPSRAHRVAPGGAKICLPGSSVANKNPRPTQWPGESAFGLRFLRSALHL
jgi:hypothetical protein